MKLSDVKVKQVGILGAGVMGGGIAQVFAVSGYRVIARDLKEDILTQTRSRIVDGRYGLKRGVEIGKTSPQQMEQALGNITFTTRVEDLKDCDLLIEAIPEDKELKRRTFLELDKLLKPQAILASNTSFISIQELDAGVKRKDRFIGMHFASPVPVMKMCEVVYTPHTSKEVLDAIIELVKKIGKVPIKVKDSPGNYGFVANRIYHAARKEAEKILEEGVASAEDIDAAMVTGYNWPVGPLTMARGARRGWE